MTILQSWPQVVQVSVSDGMRKLWSSSNIAVYGGGVKKPKFLNELPKMFGGPAEGLYFQIRCASSGQLGRDA